MPIDVVNPYLHTLLFAVFLSAAIVLTTKRDPRPHEMNHSHTTELKGIAILMVLFSHIGYFLFSDHSFLYPFSVAGGVGVNIFLFLSGFGLASSANKTYISLIDFYTKRLKNIFIPMWLVLIAVVFSDFFILGKTYGAATILQSFAGFFPNADIDTAINSPLWYFTLILFYYLLFPLVYKKTRPILSIFAVLLVSLAVVNIDLPVTSDVLKLYRLHVLAFPLGMAFAYIAQRKIGLKLSTDLSRLTSNKKLTYLLRCSLIAVLAGIFMITSINSGVGEEISVEQLSSLVTVLSLVGIFLLKNVQSEALMTLGKYSYEIYLIQWPLMYRYDVIYKHTPAFLGTILYILVFLAIGYGLNSVVRFLTNKAI